MIVKESGGFDLLAELEPFELSRYLRWRRCRLARSLGSGRSRLIRLGEEREKIKENCGKRFWISYGVIVVGEE